MYGHILNAIWSVVVIGIYVLIGLTIVAIPLLLIYGGVVRAASAARGAWRRIRGKTDE